MRTALLVFLIAHLSSLALGQATPPLTVPAIYAEGGLTGRQPKSVRWSPDGSKVSFVQRDGDHAQLWFVDVASGNKSVLVAAEKLSTLAPPPTSLSEQKQEWRDRYGVANYHWSPDSKHLLFDANGRLWFYSFDTGTAVEITSSPEPAGDPHFSPDGSEIAYVQKHNLHVRPVDGSRDYLLTHDSDEDILNGEVDWVYAEELNVRHNYAWSPDSRHILFLQTDEKRVPAYPLTDLLPLSATLTQQKYPKPGDPNPGVRLGLVSAHGGKVQWLKLPESQAAEAGDCYIPRFGWFRDRLAWAEVLNRPQNQVDLYFIDTSNGHVRRVLSEKDPVWIGMDEEDNFVGVDDHQFLWLSWRDGFTHIYLYGFEAARPLNADAQLERQLTRGDFEIFQIAAVDRQRGEVFFVANRGDARERQVFRVRLDGGGLNRISREPGTHDPSFGGRDSRYVDNFSALMIPPRLALCDQRGACRVFWQSQPLQSYDLLPPKWLDFHADDGTVLYGWLLLPSNPSGKFPLLMNPYGGPGEQSLRDVWDPDTFLFHQMLARAGIAVLRVDNRGMAGRGRAFAAFARRDFGGVQIKDQLAALQQALAAYPQLDAGRVGFWGWSYGGTMTLWALTRTQAFKAGVAVAPVSNWREYDSIYTERYLGLPAENADLYRRSSPVTGAAGLHGALLLMHGTGDDNVHFQNSVQMTQTFIDTGKQFEFMLYPDKTHSITGAAARIDLFTRIQRHFEKELLGRP